MDTGNTLATEVTGAVRKVTYVEMPAKVSTALLHAAKDVDINGWKIEGMSLTSSAYDVTLTLFVSDLPRLPRPDGR